MPRPDIVFRAALEDEDSEDEIVVIPYTKPPPVVIDLLESESGNDSTQEDGSKRTPKKKSKKKKSRRDKEREQNNSSTDVASLGNRTNASSMSPLTVDIDNVCQVVECRPDIDGVEEIHCDQFDEPAASVEVANGSGHVVADRSISSTGTSSATPSILAPVPMVNGVSGSSSHLEKCLDAPSESTEGNGGERTETGMVMAGTPLAPKNKQKRVKSGERKSKGEGKSRKRTLSATQRTNEEIVTFLTTLGIQMEPSAFETPVTRRRQPRKRPPQPPIDPTGENSLDSSTTNSNDGQNFPAPLKEAAAPKAFVTVSQDFSSPSKRDNLTPKGKRQRKAISGDLSDYRISFTNKDLNAINTSFQSNVVIAETDRRQEDVEVSFITVGSENSQSKQDHTAEVIDAVARGLDSTSLLTMPSSVEFERPKISSAAELPASSITVATEMDIGVGRSDNGSARTENHGEADETNEQVSIQTDSSVPVDLIGRPSTTLTAKEGSATCLATPPVDNCVEENESPRTTEKISSSSTGDNASLFDPSCIMETTDVPNLSTNVPKETIRSKTTKTKTPRVAAVENEMRISGLDRDNRNKRKYGDVDLSEKTTRNITANESQLDVRGKENSRFSRKSPERKRHKSNYDTTAAAPRSSYQGSDVQKPLQTGTSPKILSPSCQAFQNEIVTPRHVPNEPYFPTTWSDQMRDFYGSSQNEYFELDEVWPTLPDSSHLWKAYKDMMPPPRNKRRNVRCDRCKQLGHLIKECKEKWKPPTCHYCGKVGHTSDNHSRHSRTCPNAMCLNCGRRSSRYAQKCHSCLLQSRPSRCEICNVPGHDKLICPDNWRRYHSVTSPGAYEEAETLLRTDYDWDSETGRKTAQTAAKNSKVYKRHSSMYCANCGRRGHSYYDCAGSKFNPYPRNKPFIIREPPTAEAAVMPSSSASSTCIPISYDSRTGRTVLMNAEANLQPELTVETIQVKITNDLAFQNEESETQNFQVVIENDSPAYYSNSVERSTSGNEHYLQNDSVYLGCENKYCTNKLRSDEKCYQILMETKAHRKFLGDQQSGVLKSIEEKHQTQISVINDGCKIHICGLNALDTDKDLHLLLRGQPIHKIRATPGKRVNNISKSITQKACSSGSHADNRDASSAGRSVEVVTVNDDEENVCVIIESEDAVRKKKKTSGLSTSARNNRSVQSISQSFFMDHSPSVVDVDLESFENIEEAKSNAKSDSDEETPCDTPASKSSWSVYVSPLTGMPIVPINSFANFSTTNEEKNSKTSTKSHRDFEKSNQSMLPSRDEAKNNPASSEASVTGFGTDSILPATAPITDHSKNATVGTIDDPSEFFEFEEIDYANAEHLAKITQGNAALSESANSSEDTDSDSDLIVLDPPAPVVEKNVEIITIEDDDEPVQKKSPTTIKGKEESVTLLPSEWNLAITEVVRKNNVINQISEEFQVDIIVSKETSSIIIKNGADHNRKIAKDEIVCWLESQCLNTEYHLARRRVSLNAHNEDTATPAQLKGKKKPKPRVLKLHDVVQNNLTNDLRSNKKRKKKKRKFFNQNSSANSNSFNTPSSSSSSSSFQSTNSNTPSPSSQQAAFNKRNINKSGSNSKGRKYSPSPKKMQHHNGSRNNSDVSFPIASSKAFFPRQTRYFQN